MKQTTTVSLKFEDLLALFRSVGDSQGQMLRDIVNSGTHPQMDLCLETSWPKDVALLIDRPIGLRKAGQPQYVLMVHPHTWALFEREARK